MAESQIDMTSECLVGRRVFRKPGNVTEDRVPAFYLFYLLTTIVHKLAFCQVFIKRTWYGMVWYGMVMRSDTGPRPVRAATSEFLM